MFGLLCLQKRKKRYQDHFLVYARFCVILANIVKHCNFYFEKEMTSDHIFVIVADNTQNQHGGDANTIG